MVISEALNEIRTLLKKSDIDPREARLLLAYSMGILADDLIKINSCTKEEYSKCISYVKRRVNGEPFAYIVGYKEFMKLKFFVDNNVLIPREDTEILAEEAIKLNKKSILDMCTGSGCIAISLAKYIDKASVDAVDISKNALKIARKNAKFNKVNVNFINSDLFENVSKKYGLIISNPPYIPSLDIEELQCEVKNEPHIALDGGTDGLDFYKKISKEALKYLVEGGVLMYEIGYDQAESVSEILKDCGYDKVEVKKDLSGNDRVVIARKGDVY